MELTEESEAQNASEQAPTDWDTETLIRNFTIDAELYKVVSPVLLTVGIPGNFLCAYLWLQRRLRTSSGLYLSALGLAEFCFLLMFIVQYAERAFGARITTSYFTCKTFVPVFYFTQYLHPLLTAAYTIERWYAVTFPFKAYKVCTIKVAGIVIGCLAAFSACVASAQLPFWQYNEAADLCDLEPEVLDQTALRHQFYNALTWIIEMFFFAVIPVIVLIVNIIVIVITRRVAKSDVTKNVARLQERKSAQGNQAAATTVTLLILSFYFICTTLPVSTCSILSLKFPGGNTSHVLTYEQIANDHVWTATFRFNTIRTIIQDCFGLSQYCCAFYIYVATSLPFRKAAIHNLARWLPCFFRKVYQQILRNEMLELTGINSTESSKFVRKPSMTRADRDAQLSLTNGSSKKQTKSKSKALVAFGSNSKSRDLFKWRMRERVPKTRKELDEIRFGAVQMHTQMQMQMQTNGAEHANATCGHGTC